MTTAQLIVTLAEVAVSGFIAWYFWFAPKGQTRAAAAVGGVQEVAMTVKSGYTPDVIVVKAGQPVRLRFTRQGSASGSAMALFPDSGQSARLPEGEESRWSSRPRRRANMAFNARWACCAAS